jgi:hypothetical protein
MTTELFDGVYPGLFARARDILLRPQTEWRRVAAEEPGALIGSYVVPLALAGAITSFAAGAAYGGFDLDATLAWRGVAAALYVVFAVLGVIVAGPLIGFLVKRFGGEAGAGRTRQLAAYSATPILVATFGAVAPPVAAILMACGVVYALLLLAVGLKRLTILPDADNNVPRLALTFAVLAAIVAALAAAFVGPVVNSGRDALTGAVEAVTPDPPAPEIERRAPAELVIDRLAQAFGAHVLTDPARLEAQFPDSLPSGFARQSVVTAQGGGVSRADANFASGAATMHVAIIQFSYDADPAGGAALFDIKPDGQTTTGYVRTQSIDGRFFAEEVDGENARYIVIGRGVAMIADGRVTVDQARAAVETIDLQRLESMFGR